MCYKLLFPSSASCNLILVAPVKRNHINQHLIWAQWRMKPSNSLETNRFESECWSLYQMLSIFLCWQKSEEFFVGVFGNKAWLHFSLMLQKFGKNMKRMKLSFQIPCWIHMSTVAITHILYRFHFKFNLLKIWISKQMNKNWTHYILSKHTV